jgi:hypothetical protein
VAALVAPVARKRLVEPVAMAPRRPMQVAAVAEQARAAETADSPPPSGCWSLCSRFGVDADRAFIESEKMTALLQLNA